MFNLLERLVAPLTYFKKFVLSIATKDLHHLYEMSPLILALGALLILSIKGIYNLVTVATPWMLPLKSFLLLSTLGPTMHLFPYLSGSYGEVHDPSTFLNVQFVSEFSSAEHTMFFDVIYNNPWYFLGIVWLAYTPFFYLTLINRNLRRLILAVSYIATTAPEAIVLLLSLVLDFSPEMSTLRFVLSIYNNHYYLHDFTTGAIMVILDAVAPPIFLFSLLIIALDKWQSFVKEWNQGKDLWK